jgi:hypothetical protein
MNVNDYIHQHKSESHRPSKSKKRHRQRRPAFPHLGTIGTMLGTFGLTTLLSNAGPLFFGGLAMLFFLFRGCSMIPNHARAPVAPPQPQSQYQPPRVVPQDTPPPLPQLRLRYAPLPPSTVAPPPVAAASPAPPPEVATTPSKTTEARIQFESYAPRVVAGGLFFDTKTATPIRLAEPFRSAVREITRPADPTMSSPPIFGEHIPTFDESAAGAIIDHSAPVTINPRTPLFQDALGRKYVGTSQMSGQASIRVGLSIDRVRDSGSNVTATLSARRKGRQSYTGTIEDNPARLVLNPVIRTEPGHLQDIILPSSAWHLGPSQITLMISEEGKLLIGDSTGGEHFELTPYERS